MSKERLKEIYEKLNGEPTPEEEEQAKEDILSLLEKMIEDTDDDSEKALYNEALQLTKSWDTLDKWFVEVPELVDKIKEITIEDEPEAETMEEKKDSLTAAQNKELSKEIAEAIAEATQDLPSQVDIKQIVKEITKQVTKNFLANLNRSSGSAERQDSSKAEAKTKTEKASSKLSLSKDDIMKDMLKVKTGGESKSQKSDGGAKSESKAKLKLSAPKIHIPKVVKPKKKIVPKKKPEAEPKPVKDKRDAESTAVSESQPKQKPTQTTVKLPKPKKISIPQAQKIKPKQKKAVPQQESSEEAHKPKRVVIKRSSIEKPKKQPKMKIKTVKSPPQSTVIDEKEGAIKLQPIKSAGSKKKSSPKIKPVTGSKPKIKPAASVKPKTKKKPKINVSAKPVSVAQKKPQSNEIKTLKPVKMPKKDSKNALFQAFNKGGQKDSKKNAKTRVGGVKAVNIAGGEIEGFKAQSVDAPKEQFEFAETSGDIYANMSKDELYQELIALEGKKYAIERARKDMRGKHEKGQVPDVEYKTAIERFKYDLEHISDKINDLRRRVQTL